MTNRGVKIQIDRQALIHNFLIAKRAAPHSRTLAVIKANAYGHGAIECAKTLTKYADGYAVVFLDEARQLRSAGISLPILLLQGAQSCDISDPIFCDHQEGVPKRQKTDRGIVCFCY